MSAMATYEKPRVDWVDYAKGICIIMGGDDAFDRSASKRRPATKAGCTAVVAFAKPFRMPDFFLISGLFLGRVLDRNWRDYLDKKVVHFFYFYVLWVTIQFAFKAPVFLSKYGVEGLLHQYLLAYIEPFGTLWFIYMLPVMFILVKATRRIPPIGIFAIAAALEIAKVNTGWLMIDEFCARFVYFFAGYWLAKHVFTYAALVQANLRVFAIALLLWALTNGVLVFGGYAEATGISLALGFAGSFAVITAAAIFAQMNWLTILRYAGENSIVVYLAFFLPMAATRVVLLKTGIIPDLGTVSLIVTLVGVTVPLLFHAAIRGTKLDFLFVRPAAFHLPPAGKRTLQPAE
jgi:uncharacterized membrane protein YcfT